MTTEIITTITTGKEHNEMRLCELLSLLKVSDIGFDAVNINNKPVYLAKTILHTGDKIELFYFLKKRMTESF